MAPALPIHPPKLSDDHLETLCAQVKDYQITHGSLIKLLPGVNNDADLPVQSVPIGATLFPTPWPRKLFQRALDIQQTFNELYIRVAEDPEWLGDVLAELRLTDELVGKLWAVWEAVRDEQREQESMSLGIFRSDYMLHDENGTGTDLDIRQVEFNTFSVAGGTHGNIVADMHAFLCRSGAFANSSDARKARHEAEISQDQLPKNDTIKGIVAALSAAHKAYGPPRSAAATAILMLVQSRNINIADERPIEYALWSQSPAIRVHRAVFDASLLSHTSLSQDKRLLFHPPHGAPAVEIAVVYFRAGYDAAEYDEGGIEARVRLERSAAVMCPGICAHLATLKKVQQALCTAGALERFLSPSQASLLHATFAPMLALDDTSEAGRAAREICRDEDAAGEYVLKPSREGGGNNVYGADIPRFLRAVEGEGWGRYVLMERIRPPMLKNVLVGRRGEYAGRVVSELGVFGVCLCRRKGKGKGVEGDVEILRNEAAGWSFKTKAEEVDEMSVVKGYGCFDCPRLVG